jgi:hypothetical protein
LGKHRPGQIRALFGRKPGQIKALFGALPIASTYHGVFYDVIHIRYPFLYPFYPLLQKTSAKTRSPLLVARSARLKPLYRSVPLRSTSLAAFNAATQPIRPALRADKKRKIHARRKNFHTQPPIGTLQTRWCTFASSRTDYRMGSTNAGTLCALYARPFRPEAGLWHDSKTARPGQIRALFRRNVADRGLYYRIGVH